MSDIVKEKMNVLGDYYLTNSMYFKEQLNYILRPIENEQGEELLTKESFSNIFINLHVKILYIDCKSLDFICGDKIVKMEFTKPLFKDISLSPETGDIFKIIPHNYKRISSIFYVSSLLTSATFAVLDFKCLESIKVFDNKDPEITDMYYGGLFKLKEAIEKQESKTQKMLNDSEVSNSNGSLFHKEVNPKPIFISEEKSRVLEYHTPKSGNFLFENKSMPEFEQKCIDTINLVYNTNITKVKLTGNVFTRRYGNLFNICILKDDEIDYILISTFDGEIFISMDKINNLESALKNVFDYFIFTKGI